MSDSSQWVANVEKNIAGLKGNIRVSAALLFAVPKNSAPGIDTHFDDAALGFRSLVVARTDNVVQDAYRLRGACEQKFPAEQFRDPALEKGSWIGWYRSGSRVYTSGVWPFFAIPELSIEVSHASMLFPLLEVLQENPMLLAHKRLTISPQRSGLAFSVTLIFPPDFETGFVALLPNMDVEEFSSHDQQESTLDLDDALTASVEEVSQALDGVDVQPIILEYTPDMLEAELLCTLPEEGMLIVPLKIDKSKLTISLGVPLERLEASAETECLISGFDILGTDRTEPASIVMHQRTGLIALLVEQ